MLRFRISIIRGYYGNKRIYGKTGKRFIFPVFDSLDHGNHGDIHLCSGRYHYDWKRTGECGHGSIKYRTSHLQYFLWTWSVVRGGRFGADVHLPGQRRERKGRRIFYGSFSHEPDSMAYSADFLCPVYGRSCLDFRRNRGDHALYHGVYSIYHLGYGSLFFLIFSTDLCTK